jgi:hypothetical protein
MRDEPYVVSLPSALHLAGILNRDLNTIQRERREFVVDRTPMSEVVRTIERWQEVRLVLDDSSIAGCRVTGIVRSDQPPADVVHAIARSLQLEAHQEVLVFRIRAAPGGGGTRRPAPCP